MLSITHHTRKSDHPPVLEPHMVLRRDLPSVVAVFFPAFEPGQGMEEI
jgi:hypothetical protein